MLESRSGRPMSIFDGLRSLLMHKMMLPPLSGVSSMSSTCDRMASHIDGLVEAKDGSINDVLVLLCMKRETSWAAVLGVNSRSKLALHDRMGSFLEGLALF